MIASMSSVGVIGLGNMGARIARRLLEAGHEVVVWNRTAAKAHELTKVGATAASNPLDAADRAEVILTMLADPFALLELVEGTHGLASSRAHLTMIEMSTVGPETVARVAERLPSNIDLLDAPVLGSTSEVEEGRLTIFAGGPSDLVRKWAPLLEVLGRVLHVGPLGSGAALKLVANSTLLAALTAVGEAVALGRRLGLKDDVLFEVLSATPLAAQAERRRASIKNDDYPLRFALALAHKDADLIVEAAAASGLDLHVAAAAREWFIEAERAGLGEEDYSTVLKHILGTA